MPLFPSVRKGEAMRMTLNRGCLLVLAILSPAAVLAQETKPAKRTEFETIHVIAGENRFDVSASFGTFTLDGPKLDSLKPLPTRIQKVAVDPETKKMYGISSHEVFRIDGATAEILIVPSDLSS